MQEEHNQGVSARQLLVFLQLFVLGAVVLYFGRQLFIPLSFAVFISFSLYPLCKWLEIHRVPKSLAISISLLLVLVFISIILFVFISQVQQFGAEWPRIKERMVVSMLNIAAYLQEHYGLSTEQQIGWLKKFAAGSANSIFPTLRSAAYSSMVSLVLVILIPFYVSLILYYRRQFSNALFSLFPPSEKEVLLVVLKDTVTTYTRFLKGMAIIYLIVGILNSLGLLILGIPHPFLFGFIASILTFIPYIGITVGSLLPIGIAWITFNSIWYPLGVVAIFVLVQYLEANIIFPLAVSNRLKLNPFITLIAIISGGILWGASGMILFVPFAAILKLISDKYKRLEVLSKFLA